MIDGRTAADANAETHSTRPFGVRARAHRPGPSVNDPSVCVISTEELQSLVFCLGSGLSSLESQALTLYLEGNSYEEMAEDLGCDTKTIDNALQRVKRKVLQHQQERAVLD